MIYTMQQGSEEWFEIRKGRLTASHATAIGNVGKGLETYVRDIVENMIQSKEYYTNKDIERGNELEPIARQVYEFENNVFVKQVGFITHGDYAGCSPDGLIENDGGLELKARNNKIHLGLLLGDKVDSSTIWQMNFNMLVTGRKWWDFGSYNPNFKKSLIVQRFYPDEKKQVSLKAGIIKGMELLKELLNNTNIINELKNK
jgi:hypothetical protein